MTQRALIDVHFHGRMTCCEFLDQQLTSHTDMQIIFRYLDNRAITVPGMELILDFQHVSHVSSEFISHLHDLRHQLLLNKGSIVLAQVPDSVFAIFDMVHLGDAFIIHRLNQKQDNPVDRIGQLCKEAAHPHPTMATKIMSIMHQPIHLPTLFHHEQQVQQQQAQQEKL